MHVSKQIFQPREARTRTKIARLQLNKDKILNKRARVDYSLCQTKSSPDRRNCSLHLHYRLFI